MQMHDTGAHWLLAVADWRALALLSLERPGFLWTGKGKGKSRHGTEEIDELNPVLLLHWHCSG
jgi:hypothetical protein